jgi:ubiquitin-conjugating enzyme E2 D
MENKRLLKELNELQSNVGYEDVGPSVLACTVGDNIRHWHASIFGPKDSLYEGGTFKIDIIFP